MGTHKRDIKGTDTRLSFLGIREGQEFLEQKKINFCRFTDGCLSEMLSSITYTSTA